MHTAGTEGEKLKKPIVSQVCGQTSIFPNLMRAAGAELTRVPANALARALPGERLSPESGFGEAESSGLGVLTG
jgi:hypothetical protein